VFDGLLPEPHNSAVLDLLFVMAHWHGLAKLRMHHDVTLDIMESLTVSLGKLLRSFRDVTCPAFKTKELRREAEARARRELRKERTSHQCPSNIQAESSDASRPVTEAPAGSEPSPSQPTPERQGTSVRNPQARTSRRWKTFNINTYKGHSYGDYVRTIRQYGTMDSFSTEPVRQVRILFVSHLTAF
jgi:hypothetical protein